MALKYDQLTFISQVAFKTLPVISCWFIYLDMFKGVLNTQWYSHIWSLQFGCSFAQLNPRYIYSFLVYYMSFLSIVC